MSIEKRNLSIIYPELAAGGFSRVDGTVAFYTRVNALLRSEMIVLDYGAGRGGQLDDGDAPYRARLARLQGKVARLIGVDVDAAVLDNPFLDEAATITLGAPLPFADATFDMVLSDWVFEHVSTPDLFAQEIWRVLKPGGWLCARTPNRWGMIGIAANLVPSARHTSVLARLTPGRQSHDVFPTAYRMNTLRRLRAIFPAGQWHHCTYASNSEPAYIQRSRLLIRLVKLAWRLLPAGFATTLNIFIQKRDRA